MIFHKKRWQTLVSLRTPNLQIRPWVRGALKKEHRETAFTDWNATLWIYRMTQDKSDGVFRSCPIGVKTNLKAK